jgi:hypothetical protein
MSTRNETATEKTEGEHWLRRPDTIRKLWIGGILLSATLVLLDLLIKPYAYFGLDGTFGFYAWFAFGTSIAMVIGANTLGIFLKRKDTYYDRD